MTRLERWAEAALAQARKSLAADAGLRVTYETGGIFLKMQKSGDYTLLHDYLKSCIRHGMFALARATIGKYVDLRKRGYL